jgi:two-component system KDP operon response regulator KdpE
MEALNSRLDAGRRVVNMLPHLQHADDPVSLLAETVRVEYAVSAVFFWVYPETTEQTHRSVISSMEQHYQSSPVPEFVEVTGTTTHASSWNGLRLEYTALEMSGKAYGVMAVAAPPTQLHTDLVRQHVALLLENVTLFQQLKRDDERLSAVFDSAPLGFVLIAKSGEILLVNGKAAMLLPNATAGADIVRVCGEGVYFAKGGKPFAATDLPILQALVGNVVHRIEIVHEIAQERIPVRHEVVAIGHTGFLLVIEDQRQFLELERLKTDFISMISHELRTPLAAIIGATTLLSQGKSFHRDGIHPTIELIRAQGTRLQALIDDVLNVAHIETNGVTLHREKIDAAALINKIASRDADWKHWCRVTVRETHDIDVDVGRIEQVCTNILQNAIKYAPERHIDIEIGPLDADTGMLVVTFRDYGTPLPDTEYARVFERFYQAHQHATTGGSGLGLAICKYFVEAHGGTIGMHATPLRDGTVVHISLPIVQTNALDRSAVVSSFHALIVEDDPVLPRMIARAFAENHGTCEVVTTVREAYECVERGHYDVLLVDVRLPDVSGLEFVRTVRGWLVTPIIIMTANGHENDLLDALRMGVDDYVVKPFSATEIALRVHNVLRRKGNDKPPKAQLRVGNCIAYLQSKTIEIHERAVDVTPIEYRLFVLFTKHIGQILTHEQILAEVWGNRYDQATQYLWVHISHLRRKLASAGAVGFQIDTVRGVGYRLSLGDE